MASLRSGPKRKGRGTKLNISAPMPTADGLPPRITDAVPISRPRPTPQGGDKTGDLVKRRYSTRFNNLPTGFDASAPPMPSLPPVPKPAPVPYDNMYKSQYDHQPPPPRPGAAPKVDIKALRDPGLLADSFVANALADAMEDQIRDYEDELRNLKIKAQSDLQQTVIQNRTQFIKISKEAEKLKSELRALKNLMAELKTNTMALRSTAAKEEEESANEIPGVLSVGVMSKRDKRSSVADRSALWNSQLQALYKNVEGSQKFLPTAAGRHVIQNAGPWIELDNATYKSRRAMQIFLLNDHLLIASRKKRKADAGGDARGPAQKLVADRCWSLLDIEIVDMAGTKDSLSGRNKLADAIMVRGVGQESFIYRTEKTEDPEKGRLLLAIRKAVEELRKGLQSEMDANNKAKETINYFASRDPGLLQKTELLETLSDIKDMLIDVDGKQQNLRWVEGEMDELDVHIAQQQFEVSTELVEKMRNLARGLKNNIVAQDFIDFKVDERCARLATMLIRELEITHDKSSKTKLKVDWLSRLGYEDRAREAYLGARSTNIQKMSRQCVFKGDLHEYIWQLSYVYFTLIQNTVSTFQLCFPQPMMSACVHWAKDELEAFNVILARQLSGTEKGSEEWNRCVDQAKEHASKLAEIGFDFRDMVGLEPLKDDETMDSKKPVGLGLTAGA